MSSWQLVATIVGWAGPPVIGAVIGWITNDIAIRMLFRPLREVRVLGIRLPFTPGIIPKERGRLAKSIGQMVSRELITEEALRRQIHEPKALEALSTTVAKLTAEVLSRPLGSFGQPRSGEGAAGPVDGPADGPTPDVPRPFVPAWIEELLRSLAVRLTGSRAFIQTVRDLAGRLVASVAAMRPGDIRGFDIERFLADRVLPLLAQPDTRASVAEALGALLSERAGELATDDVLDRLVGMLRPAIPPVLDRLMEWVRSAETRAILEREARQFLSTTLEQLNVLQRLIVSAGQFDRRLDERMPQVVEELIAAIERIVRDADTQERAMEAIGRAARDWRDRLGRDPSSVRGLSSTAAGLVDGLLAGLADPGKRQRAAHLIRERLARGDATIGGIARRALGLDESQVAEYLSARALEWLTRAGTAGAMSHELSALAHRFVEDNAAVTLGELLGVDAARKERLDAALTERLVGVIDTRLREILLGVNVEELVVRKVDSLDVLDVERLLLQVIASQLRWVIWFGAILGFVIGLGQLALQRMIPHP